MKTPSTLRLLLLFVAAACISTLSNAQVADIGITFTKHGFIQETALPSGFIIVNFVDKENISTEILLLNQGPVIEIDGKSASKEQLKCGMEVLVTGDYFETKKASVAQKISVTSQTGKEKNIENGRVDLINGQFAYVDGNKVKLADRTKITGVKKSGYAGKTFNSFTELKLGDYINCKGKYSADGYLLANNVTLEPETQSVNDKMYLELLKDFQEKYYTTWADSASRSQMFGMQFENQGRIVNNAALQEYVSKIGMSLIPPHIKQKYKCMFMVVDNVGWNANMRPNGVCVVYIGLLFAMQNEAQLAAVLGHEISHAIYEHTAERNAAYMEAEKGEKTKKKISALVTDVTAKIPQVLSGIPQIPRIPKVRVITPDDFKNTTSILIQELPNARNMKKLSDYSIDNELQADRVGLTLMAHAGYDVREAPIVWKNKFNSSPKNAANQTIDNTSERDARNPLKRKGDLVDLGLGYINFGLQNKADKLRQQSARTHPDNVTRFEELNRLVSKYYSDNLALESAITGEKKYIKIVDDYYNSLLAEADKAEQEAKKAQQKRPLLDKQFKAAVPKIKERLQALTKPIITYKGYSLKPIISLNELLGKLSCNSSAISEEITNASFSFNTLADIINDFAKKFDAGEIEPNAKDKEFAFCYLLSKGTNELAINIAAAASICDFENVVKYNPSLDDFNAVIEYAQHSQEFDEILAYLTK